MTPYGVMKSLHGYTMENACLNCTTTVNLPGGGVGGLSFSRPLRHLRLGIGVLLPFAGRLFHEEPGHLHSPYLASKESPTSNRGHLYAPWISPSGEVGVCTCAHSPGGDHGSSHGSSHGPFTTSMDIYICRVACGLCGLCG